MTTIQIFRKMFDYLVANKLIHNQTELARAVGLNEVSVSRILNGQVKKTKQETLWKVNVNFGNVFNPEWLRGESDVMLAADLAPVSADATAATEPDGSPSGVASVAAYCDRILREARVWLNPGTMYGPQSGEGYLRINIACPRSLLLEALERIKNIKR